VKLLIASPIKNLGIADKITSGINVNIQSTDNAITVCDFSKKFSTGFVISVLPSFLSAWNTNPRNIVTAITDTITDPPDKIPEIDLGTHPLIIPHIFEASPEWPLSPSKPSGKLFAAT
jgi:hypothetical protein